MLNYKPIVDKQKSITLNGSKSISNRVLMIQALCDQSFEIKNCSTAKDTSTLLALLNQVGDNETLDTGAAGTTYRFLTSYLAFNQGTQILTGSERMKQRPIKVLVDVLRTLGADIEYLEDEGYPPLKIFPPKYNSTIKVSLPAHVSSQYISSLMLLAPSLPNGLEITLEGGIVSLPYLLMTKKLMEQFGVRVDFEDSTFKIKNAEYIAKPFDVEGDWSAASYYYTLVAFEKIGYTLKLNGLFEDSVQGDQVIAEISAHFGVETVYENGGITLKKVSTAAIEKFDYDYILCPDLAQSVSVMMAGLGIAGTFTGLQTLRIKETDRILALQQELNKIGIAIDDQDQSDQFYQEGKCVFEKSPIFDTYEDHRMAMSLACLAVFGDIGIQDPMVVVKSYPDYWTDLNKIGITILT